MQFAPKRVVSHFCIQYELYRLLVNAGFKVYPEYIVPVGKGRPGGDSYCKIDLVLHDGKEVYLGIEVKRTAKGIQSARSRSGVGTVQNKKYNSLDIDFMYVCEDDDLTLVVGEIVNKYGSRVAR